MSEKRSKWILGIFCVIGIAIIAVGIVYIELYCRGDVSNVKKEISSSELYTDQEIEAAMDEVLKEFRFNFKGCTLTDLWYEESDTKEAAAEWAEDYEAEEAIILLSNFTVDASGGDGSFSPNESCTNWEWILVRNSEEDTWTLKTWGY